MSALHFGLGELEVAREITGWRPGGATAVAIVAAGAGALVLPLVRSGDQFSSVAVAVSPGLAEVIGASPVRIGLFAAWLAAALVAVPQFDSLRALLGCTRRRAHRRARPAAASVAGVRGVVRRLACVAALRAHVDTEPGSAALLDRGRGKSAVLHLAKLAALPSIVALTAVMALGWFTVTAPDSAVVMAEVLRLILALTVPHMVVVMWLDRAPRLPGPSAVNRPPQPATAAAAALSVSV